MYVGLFQRKSTIKFTPNTKLNQTKKIIFTNEKKINYNRVDRLKWFVYLFI